MVEPYVNENAASQTLTVKTEGNARFAVPVSAACRNRHRAVWRNGPSSLFRVCPTRRFQSAFRVPNRPPMPPWLRRAPCLSIAASCIEVPTESSSEDDAAIQEVREKLEASNEEDGETFLSEDDDSIDLAALENDAAYDVSIPFVHPSLLVDVADTQVGQSATVYRIVASEFSFPANVSAGDFSVQLSASAPADAAAPAVQDVVRVNDFELDVTVSSDASVQGGPLDYAALIMSAASSGTGGEVCCPFVSSRCLGRCGGGSLRRQFRGRLAASSEEVAAAEEEVAAEEEAVAEGGNAPEDGDYFDTVTVSTTLHNADVSAEENTAVSVLTTDGTYKEVKAVQTQVNPDGVDRTFNVRRSGTRPMAMPMNSRRQMTGMQGRAWRTR